MLGFELLELVHEPVKGSVRNFWIVYNVIQILVTLNFFAQALDFSSGVTAFRHGNLDSGMRSVKTPLYYTMRLCSKNSGTDAMPDGINDALLIYNPTSGRKRHRRFVEVEQAAAILKDSGISTELASTTARASATTIARQAVEQRRGMV